MRFGLMYMYPNMNVSQTGGSQQAPFPVKPQEEPSQNQEEVKTQKISIFSTYDTNQDANINSSDTKHKSIFQLNTSALNSLKPANVAENAQNLSTIRKVANAQIGGVANKFSEMVNNFRFNVGKETVVQEIKADRTGANDSELQTITSKLNTKVENEINKMNTQYNQMVSDSYTRALDEVASQIGNKNPNLPDEAENGEHFVDEISQPDGIGTAERNEDGTIKHLDGTKVDSDGNTVTDANTKVEKTTQEVFSKYDGNKDKHVKFNELDSSLFTRFTGTVDSHVNTSTAGGREIDKFANYDVDTKFNEYIQAFDANVGSKTLTAKESKIDESKINAEIQKLNNKAETKAKEFANRVNNQVARERTAALESAYQQYLRDPNGVKEANNQRELAKSGLGGALTTSDGTTIHVDASDVTDIRSLPRDQEGSRITNSENSHQNLASQTLNSFDQLFDALGSLSVGENGELAEIQGIGDSGNRTVDKNKFNRCVRGGLSKEIAGFVASDQNAKPIFSGNRVVAVEFKDNNNNKIVVKKEHLEGYVHNKRTNETSRA